MNRFQKCKTKKIKKYAYIILNNIIVTSKVFKKYKDIFLLLDEDLNLYPIVISELKLNKDKIHYKDSIIIFNDKIKYNNREIDINQIIDDYKNGRFIRNYEFVRLIVHLGINVHQYTIKNIYTTIMKINRYTIDSELRKNIDSCIY